MRLQPFIGGKGHFVFWKFTLQSLALKGLNDELLLNVMLYWSLDSRFLNWLVI